MRKKIKVRTDKKGVQYFKIDDFADYFDTGKIAYYQIKKNSDDSIYIVFYDLDRNVLSPINRNQSK